jgi:putative ABC transport system permease protein
VLKHYITQALRSFWRFRVTALVNLFGLSLALVCFVATYLFLDTVLQTGDRAFKNASRTYVLTQELWTTPTNRMIPAFPQVGAPTAKYLRADLPALEVVARAANLGSVAAATDDRSVYLAAAAVDPEFLKIFDLKPLEGELREALSSAHSAILTANAAIRLFGTKQVVGRTILLQNRSEVTISAVIDALPAGSHMGETATQGMLRFEILLPMDLLKIFNSSGAFGFLSDPDSDNWGNDVYFTYVLLPSNGSVTLPLLQETLRALPGRHIAKDQIISVFGAVPLVRVKLASLEALFSNSHISVTTTPFLLDTLILIIACLNYANLTVAIATTRAREIGIRKVLGASQPHLMRQYLVEAGLLGGVALILVFVGTALVVPAVNRAFGLEFHVASLLQPQLWGLVLLLLAIISLVGGAYPALVLSRVRPVESLRAGTVRTGPRFVPTILVGVQFAAASFLLVVALLISAQNHVLQRLALSPGRDPVVVINNDIRQIGVSFDSLRNELLRDPHVKSVSGAVTPPWQSGGSHQVMRRSSDPRAATLVTMMNLVFYDFFPTAGINIVAGRDFDRQHADEFSWDPAKQRGAASVIIDRALAAQMGWSSSGQAVDQTIYMASPWDPNDTGYPVHVIGVAENGYPRLVGPNADSNMYVVNSLGASVPYIRIAREDIPAALAHIDAVWKTLVPKVPMRRSFSDELFNISYEDYAAMSGVVTGLSACAFVIAIMGLIGMAIHITSRRLHEIGIRKTLGATAGGVVLMLLRDFSKPVLIANLIAWPFAFFLGRLYYSMFTHHADISAWPFVLSLAITVAIAWLAVGAQALRAASVKPALVLHSE